MGVWKPTKDGKTLCTRHDVTFPKGHVCAMCAVDPPPASKDTAAPGKRRRGRGKLPSTADHEAAFVVLAELAETWAREEDEEVRNWVPPEKAGDGQWVAVAPTRSVAARLLAEATKARGRAAALALAREDWEATERLEKAARALDQAGPMRVRTVASEARH